MLGCVSSIVRQNRLNCFLNNGCHGGQPRNRLAASGAGSCASGNINKIIFSIHCHISLYVNFNWIGHSTPYCQNISYAPLTVYCRLPLCSSSFVGTLWINRHGILSANPVSLLTGVIQLSRCAAYFLRINAKNRLSALRLTHS